MDRISKDKEEVKCEKCGRLVFRENLDKQGRCSECRDKYNEKSSRD